MKGFKKFLTVLIAAIMCLELIPGIALASEPTYTWYAVARNNTTFLNTQDGKTMAEFNYNNVNSGNKGANWGYYGGYTKGKFLAMYLKFDLSELKGKNVKDAAVYAGFGGNGTSFRMYGIPNEDWDDTTAPVIDRSEGNLIASVTKMSPSVTVEGFGERNTEFACGDLVKKALANGDDYICFEIECTNGDAYSSIWGKATTSPSYPKLAYKVSSNNIPVVEVSADKESYAPGETVTVTASSTDADGDAVTYSFKVDGVENTDNVSGNVLTIDTLACGTHTIDVTGTDECGDSSSASINIVVKKTAEMTEFSVSRNKTTFLNTQDGKTMAEFNYNNVNSGNNGANWGYYGGYTKEKFLAMYLKFDLSELKGKNVKDAAVYAGFGGNGTSFRMYGIPNEDWDDTTAPVIDRSEGNLIASVTKMSPSVTVTGFGERNTEFACGDLVKKALENGDDYICFELECTNGGAYSTIWGKATTSPSYPKLAYKVSSNNIPVVSLSADKESYAPGETVTVTASSTDADGDAVTYSFKIDGVENTDNVSGNVLTIDTLTGGTHTIDVIGTDEYGDSSSASVNVVIKKVAEITKGALPRNKAVYLNTQDGKTMSEFSYNNVNSGNNGVNWGYYAAASTNAKFLAMYVKFDLSDYSDANIVNAKVYAGASGSSTKFRMYRIPNSDWDDERAPVVDRSASNRVGETVTKLSPSITETGYGERNLEFPCLDEIKKAIANGDKYICFEFESAETSGAYSSVWGKASTSPSYPKLYLETSSNKVPVVTATTDKDKYTDTDDIVVTASATDPDDDDFIFSFKVDGVLDTEHAEGNVLTLPPLSSGDHTIDVICTDDYGEYGIYSVNLHITGAPVKTIKTVAYSGIFNSYDEKTVADYNNSNQFSQPNNYVLSGDSARRMQLYVKFDISAYKDADISAASLFWWIQSSNHCGKTLKVYGLDADSWNTTIAPKVDRANNTLVTHVVPSTALVSYTDTDPLYSYASGYNTIFGDTQSSAPDYGITDYIKNQLAKGKTTVCFVIERTSNGYSTASKSYPPKLAIQTTTNKVPQVTLTSNKDGYKSGDDVIVTANATDADEDATLTYKFFINGVEADSSKVTDNVLNVGKFAGEDINVSVKCFDEWGDYGVGSIVIANGDAYTAIGTFTGTIASGNTLTAEGSITNKTAESVSVQIIIAVYDADGNLYDAQFTTMTIPANDSDVYGVDYELPSKDLTDYTAKAFVWESTTQTPLAPAFDLEVNN